MYKYVDSKTKLEERIQNMKTQLDHQKNVMATAHQQSIERTAAMNYGTT